MRDTLEKGQRGKERIAQRERAIYALAHESFDGAVEKTLQKYSVQSPRELTQFRSNSA